MRHRLAAVLALTACAVLAGATSLPAVGEWIADAPAHMLHQVGARPDPLLPRRALPAETTVRRLLACLDGDALGRAVESLARRAAAAACTRASAIEIVFRPLRSVSMRREGLWAIATGRHRIHEIGEKAADDVH